MGYPIFHSQYTAAQIEASIGKTPRIKASTRTWEIWDIATSAYVDTGVSIDTELFVDPTLTESGYAADAKVTGDKIGELKSALSEEVEVGYTEVTNRAILGTGEIAVRTKFGMAMLPCIPNAQYQITNPLGGYLSVGSSASSSYTQTLTHYETYTDSESCNYTTGNNEKYLFIVFWYDDNTDSSLADATSALEISYVTAVDKTAREGISEIHRDFVSWLNGKKISIIADSISTFDADGYKISGYEMYYPHGDVTSVDDMWWNYVEKLTGASIEKNAAYAGSRATNTDNTRPDFYARANSATIGNPDIIFVQLGTNDSTYNVSIGGFDYETTVSSMSEAYFRNAYIKGVKTLQTNFPSAKIVLMILKMKDAYAKSIRKIAQDLGLSYVFIQDYTTTQGDHPDKKGMESIAVKVLEFAAVALNTQDRADQRWKTGAIGEEIYTNAIRKSKNLYNPDEHCILGSGMSTAGAIYNAGTYTDRCAIAYVPVRGLSYISIAVQSNTNTSNARYCWYDKNNNPITLPGQSTAAMGGYPLYGIARSGYVAVPTDAYSVAFQLYYENCVLDAGGRPIIMVQGGKYYTGYEPFGSSVDVDAQPKDIYVSAKDSPDKYRMGADYCCNGENDELVLQMALDAVGQVGTLWLAPGTYNIESFPEQADGQYTALQYKVKRNGTVKESRVRIRCYDQTPMRQDGYSIINHCATLKVSGDCYSALDSSKNYSVIGVENDGNGDRVWNGACFDLSGIGIQIPGNQKKVVAFDAWYAFCIMMERCMATAIPTNAMPSVAGNEDCVGIKCTKGSNFGQCSQLTSCAMYGFGQGIAVSGEHYVLANCKTIYNKYGFTFNWYGDNNAGYCHPNTLINCCSEMDFNYPYFGYNGQLSSVTLIDFNMEHRTASAALGGELAQERAPGTWRGTINYTIKTYTSDGYAITGNNVTMSFWKTGHGANVKSHNDAQKQICTTTERSSYAANELQRVYDSTEGKFYTYVNGTWVEG